MTDRAAPRTSIDRSIGVSIGIEATPDRSGSRSMLCGSQPASLYACLSPPVLRLSFLSPSPLSSCSLYLPISRSPSNSSITRAADRSNFRSIELPSKRNHARPDARGRIFQLGGRASPESIWMPILSDRQSITARRPADLDQELSLKVSAAALICSLIGHSTPHKFSALGGRRCRLLLVVGPSSSSSSSSSSFSSGLADHLAHLLRAGVVVVRPGLRQFGNSREGARGARGKRGRRKGTSDGSAD